MPTAVRRFRRAWPLMLLAASACAGGGPPPLGLGGGAERLNVFFSPAGQAFRAAPGQPYPSAAWFAQADKDRDGRVTLAEFRADAEAFFHSLDTDRDGMIDGFEMAAYEAATPEMNPEIRSLRPGEGMDPSLGRPGGRGGQIDEQRPSRRNRGAGGLRQGVPQFSWFNDPQPVAAADTEFDSRITLQEARAVAERRFAMLDPMGRGYLVLSELRKTAAQARLESAADKRRNREGPGVVRTTKAPATPP
jgi:hypothetical protein